MEFRTDKDLTICTLCRVGRLGSDTLRRARARKTVTWPRQDAPTLSNTRQESVPHVSIDDAFASLERLMVASSRACKQYHNSCRPLTRGSSEDEHWHRYHSPSHQHAVISNLLSRPTAVHVEAAPGTYTVTAAQPDGSKETKLKVQLEPGKSVFLTFSV
eukprot:Em0021g370a